MPRRVGLPKAKNFIIKKLALLGALQELDESQESRKRVLSLETDFRTRIDTHINALPTTQAQFSKFNTNPFVLMFHCYKQKYSFISQIEHDILPAKVFMSMETSAGRMVEAVALPIYGWEVVPSSMHSVESVLDGKQLKGDVLRLATLKSGPRCLNDEMSKDIADDIIRNSSAWARSAGVSKIDFTYGVLYGTKKISNKKDWHILRNISEKIEAGRSGKMLEQPIDAWHCRYELDGIDVTVTVRIGIDLWNYVAGHNLAFAELCAALIRACVLPGEQEPEAHKFTIADLEAIISLEQVPKDFNVSILQRSQLEWLFFFARHFCDEIE